MAEGTVDTGDGPAGGGFSDAPAATRGFLFVDLRDYTGYTDRHGDRAAAELLDRYRGLVRAVVARSRGAEIRTEGDSFYVVFESASGAVRCGLSILEAAKSSDDGPMAMGIGVHAGETVATADGFVGLAVNIAARLCALARPGELVVSETVRSLTRSSLEVGFEPLGVRHLKGVEEPMAIYRVVPDVTSRMPARRGFVPRAPRARWSLSGAAALAVLLVLLVVTLVPDVIPSLTPPPRGDGGGAEPGPSSADPASASPRVISGVLTPAEQLLLGRVPRDFRPYCLRSSLQGGSLGGDAASLRCDLSTVRDTDPVFGADSVWYDAFSSPGLLAAALNDLVGREQLVMGECGAGGGEAIGRWSFGSTYAGRIACYTKDGRAWLAWSYEGDGVLVRAVRDDGDVGQLYAWWSDTRGFLGH